MFCWNCGKEFVGNFCPYCGVPSKPNRPSQYIRTPIERNKEKPLILSKFCNLPCMFTIDGISYNLDDDNDILNIPLKQTPFMINGKIYNIEQYLKLYASACEKNNARHISYMIGLKLFYYELEKSNHDYFKMVDDIIDRSYASISLLQRKWHMSYPAAVRVMDFLERYDVVKFKGVVTRVVLMTKEQFRNLRANQLYLEDLKMFISEFDSLFIDSQSDDEHDLHEKGINIPVNIMETTDVMDGYQFEKFCATILTNRGFENVKTIGQSGDQGIDIIAYRDGIKCTIQCKCYQDNVGNSAVQEAFAGKEFYDGNVAVVMTNQYFTKSAKELAQKNKVVLWDRGIIQKWYLENWYNENKNNI